MNKCLLFIVALGAATAAFTPNNMQAFEFKGEKIAQYSLGFGFLGAAASTAGIFTMRNSTNFFNEVLKQMRPEYAMQAEFIAPMFILATTATFATIGLIPGFFAAFKTSENTNNK